MSHIFISYVRENQSDIDRLAEELTQFGLEVWLDRAMIKPGDFWKDSIRKAIRTGNYFLACFSNEYTEKIKSYMNEELTLATEEIRMRPSEISWFIPAVLSGDVPDWDIGRGRTLRDINWVDLQGANWKRGVHSLVEVIDSSLLIDSATVRREYLYENPSDGAYVTAQYKNHDDSTPIGRRVKFEVEREQNEILQRLRSIWPNLEKWERDFIEILNKRGFIYRPDSVLNQFFHLELLWRN